MEVTLGLLSRWVWGNNSDNSLNFFTVYWNIFNQTVPSSKTEKSQESQDLEPLVPNWKSISRGSWDPKQNSNVRSIFFFSFNTVKLLRAANGTGAPCCTQTNWVSLTPSLLPRFLPPEVGGDTNTNSLMPLPLLILPLIARPSIPSHKPEPTVLMPPITSGLFPVCWFSGECVHFGVDSTRYIPCSLLNLAGSDRFMGGQMAITGWRLTRGSSEHC